MLRVRNLDAGYGKLRVLKTVSLHVGRGEIVTIVGGNGAGKSTLLNTLAGLIRPWGGEIRYRDHPLPRAPERIVFAGAALVPEGRQVFPAMSVLDNLLLGGYPLQKREGRGAVAEELDAVYHLFPVLRERGAQLAGTLSGGEQQMLAIGRALMSRPELVMMDEPSMGLAPLIVKEIFSVIVRLRESGKTVLLVEQNARAAFRIADRGYVLETGAIMLQGTAAELLENRDVQRAYLGKEYRNIASRGNEGDPSEPEGVLP